MKNLSLTFICLPYLLFSQINTPNFPPIDTGFTYSSGLTYSNHLVHSSIGYQGSYIIGGFNRDIMDIDPGPNTLIVGNSGPVYYPYLQKINSDGMLQWGRWWSTLDGNFLRKVLEDENGNIYMAGVFYGSSFDADPISSNFILGFSQAFSTSVANGYIIKLNTSGQFLWAKGIAGGPATQLAFADSTQQEIVCGGFFNNGLDTSLTANSSNIITSVDSNDLDLYLIKLDASNGQKLAEAYFQSVGLEVLNDIVATPSGNFLLAGYTTSQNLDVQPLIEPGQTLQFPNNLKTTYILHLDNEFRYLNHKAWSTTNRTEVEKLYVRNDNSFWLAGYYDDPTFNMDPSSSAFPIGNQNNLSTGYWFSQLDSSLIVQRAFNHPLVTMRSNQPNWRNPQIVFKGNDLYVGGNFEDSLALEGPGYTYPPVIIDPPGPTSFRYSQSFYLAKIDSSNALDYAYYPEASRNDDEDEELTSYFFDGNQLVVVGIVQDSSDFDPRQGKYMLRSTSGYSNFIIKLNECEFGPVPLVSRLYQTCDTLIVSN